jgi:hypothetical protein
VEGGEPPTYVLLGDGSVRKIDRSRLTSDELAHFRNAGARLLPRKARRAWFKAARMSWPFGGSSPTTYP